MNKLDLIKRNDAFIQTVGSFSTEALILAIDHAHHAHDNSGNCAPMTDLYDRLVAAKKAKIANAFKSFWMEYFPVVRAPSKADKDVLVFKLRKGATEDDWNFDDAANAELFDTKPRPKPEAGSKGMQDYANVIKKVWKSDLYDAATRARARADWEALPVNNEERIKELEAKLAEALSRDAA